MIAVKIDRSRWLHGSYNLRMYREDGCGCILGLVFADLGVPASALKDCTLPGQLPAEAWPAALPREFENSDTVQHAIYYNDFVHEDLTLEAIEGLLRETFTKSNIELTFFGEHRA